MKSLIYVMKKGLKGVELTYFFNFVALFFMVLATVFTSFLSKVLVDALSLQLYKAEYIERFVIYMISLGKGEQFIYDNLYCLPIAIVISSFILALVTIARNLLRYKCSASINKTLQYGLFSHLQRQPYSYFQKAKPGDLIQTCTRDVDVVRKFMIMELNQTAYTLFIVVLCFAILMEISYKLTLVSLSLLPFMFFYSFFLIKEVRNRYRKADDSEAMMTDDISENLNSIRVVKAYNEEIYEIKRFEDKLKDYENKYKKWRIFSSFFFSSSDIFIFATSALAIIYSLYLVYKKEITEGTLVVAYTFINMIVWPLRDSATMLSNLGQAFASADRIKKLFLEEEEDINSGIEAKINGDIEFKNVSFAYQDRKNQYALKNISFSIKKGQTVAILGKTGSGKSTLLLLLTRLFDPSQGHIYLDGIDITKISKRCVRKNIVPVLQDPFLFSKSIKDNIALSNENASDSDIYEATKIADLDKTIEGFEKGFDTPVGEKGVTLSGGQKQRVAIARTVLSKASVMIFDDSLSAVDSKTDLNIRKSLANLDKRTTKIIITSRINSAKSADKIIVLDKGQIEEIGTHEELIKNNGLYEKLDKIQERRQ